MLRLACLALAVMASCNTNRSAPKPEVKPAVVPTEKPSTDPWDMSAGSGSTAPVPKWTSDPPEVLRAKINGINAHVIVLKSTATFAEYRDVLATVERTPGVIAAEAFIFAELEIAKVGKTGKTPISVAIKGVDPSRVARVLTVGKYMQAGTLDSLGKGDPPSIILGDVLAKTLDVRVGDEVTVSPPKDPPTGMAAFDVPAIKSKVFRVSGMFHVEFDEYDERLAFVPLAALQAMMDRGDQVMGIEMTVKDLDQSGKLAEKIEATLGGPPYQAMDWYELNKELFTAMFGQRRP